MFSDVSANFEIGFATDAFGQLIFEADGLTAVLMVTHRPLAVGGGAVPGLGSDGIDTLHHIERLTFADLTIANPFAPVTDFIAQGQLILDNLAPTVGQVISIIASSINDFEGVLVGGVLDPLTAGFERIDIPLHDLNLQWQHLDPIAAGGNPAQWVNIAGATDLAALPTAPLPTQRHRATGTWQGGASPAATGKAATQLRAEGVGFFWTFALSTEAA